MNAHTSGKLWKISHYAGRPGSTKKLDPTTSGHATKKKLAAIAPPWKKILQDVQEPPFEKSRNNYMAPADKNGACQKRKHHVQTKIRPADLEESGL